MLVLYNPKTSNRSSFTNTPKSIAIQPNRIPCSHHHVQNTLPKKQMMMSKTTDDIFSNVRAHHLQIFQQVENFQRNIFKQVDDMFSMGSMGGFGGCRSPVHHMSSGTQSTRNQGPQRMISKTYVYQTKKDASGNTYHEKYFSHNYAMKGSDGTTIVERQEGYHNSGNNLQRIAEERRINAQSKKLMQEKIKGQDYIAKTVQYHNMGEEEIGHFDHAWDSHTKQLGFYRDYGNMIGHKGSSKPKATSYYPEEDYFPSQQRSQPSNNNKRNRPSSSRQPKRTNSQSLALTDGNNINNQNHARVRRNDIQPTIPSRRGGIEVQIPEQRYEPVHEPVRPQNVIRQEPRVVHHHQVNEAQERPAPVVRERPQTGGGERRQTGSVRNDGNFKNKVVTNAMPLAG